MTLVTRCPHCGTAFRVQRAQLAARGGKVRCGYCLEVFDGEAALVDQGPLTKAPDLGPESPVPDESERARSSTPAPAAPEPAANDAAAEVPPFLAPEKPRHPYIFLWSFLALLALVALTGQLVYHHRTELAILVPESRPYLLAACVAIGCEIRLPRRPDLLSIESSDLQADPRRENVLRLTALVRNLAPYAQEPPSIELTLTDETDRAVLRRVLSPLEYLGARRAAEIAQNGIPPRAEVAVLVYFDASVSATGYRLYLFYP